MKHEHFVLMEEAGDGDGSAAAPDTATAVGDASASAKTSALGQATVKPDEGQASPEPDPNEILNAVPERLRVMNAQGKLDVEASLRAVSKSYSELDTKLKGAGAPPKEPTGYKYTPPEGVALDQARAAEFQKEAHAMGLSQRQYEAIMNKYVDIVSKDFPAFMEQFTENSAEECMTSLKGYYKTDEAVGAALSDSRMVWDLYADKDAQGKVTEQDLIALDKVGNNPVLIKVLARIAKDLKEDKSFQQTTAAVMNQDDIQAVMASKAYLDKDHPEHARTVKKVMDHFNAQARIKARAERRPGQ